jgi:hypothetical protein
MVTAFFSLDFKRVTTVTTLVRVCRLPRGVIRKMSHPEILRKARDKQIFFRNAPDSCSGTYVLRQERTSGAFFGIVPDCLV